MEGKGREREEKGREKGGRGPALLNMPQAPHHPSAGPAYLGRGDSVTGGE